MKAVILTALHSRPPFPARLGWPGGMVRERTFGASWSEPSAARRHRGSGETPDPHNSRGLHPGLHPGHTFGFGIAESGAILHGVVVLLQSNVP